MRKPTRLYRTTIVIWTDYPTSGLEIDDIAREAMTGDGFCSQQQCEQITDAAQFPDTDFFDTP